MTTNNNSYRYPILDEKEIKLLEKLTEEYKKFIEPSKVSIAIQKATDTIKAITPLKVKEIAKNTSNSISEAELMKKALNVAGDGFAILSNRLSTLTISKESVIKNLNKNYHNINSYEDILSLRSYEIERIVSSTNIANLLSAFVEGTATGIPGLIGIPANIALSFLMYFRTTQLIALYYGYDVKEDPSELEFAASVTLGCLCPNTLQASETLSGLIGKMMLTANLASLKQSLNKTYAQMAEKGGLNLLFVQIRALANASAKKALEKSGNKGLENSIFKTLLEQFGRLLTKDAAKKSIPVISGLIGGFSDTYYMKKVIEGSNLIYHKRYLLEKINNLDSDENEIIS